jgi:tetratricopeptide (TPR) repeat protein
MCISTAVVILWLALLNVTAQTPSRPKDAPSPQADATEEESDALLRRWESREKALRQALKLSEPTKRISALKKLLTDYPEDPDVPRLVDEGILDTYIRYTPQQTKDILAQIDKILKKLPAKYRTGSANNPYSQIAAQLADAGILLDTAQKLAAEGLAVFDEKKFVDAQKKKSEIFANWIARNNDLAAVLRIGPRTEDDLLKMALAERAKALSTLGRVYLKQGKTSEAKELLTAAYSANPEINEANIALAEISFKAGDYAATVNYLAPVAVRVPMKPALRQQLETAYRRTHGESLYGLEAMLDELYRSSMPNPIAVGPYVSTAARTDRLVLAEVFTGAGCGPCVGADLAFEAAAKRYTNNLVLLMYHLHRPLPDPMVNPSAISRAQFYAIQRAPGFAIDGQTDMRGGAIREKANVVYDRLHPVIEKQLEVPADAHIQLDAALDGTTVKVHVTVDKLRARKTPKLRLALVEEELRYSGENLVRIHPMVVRNLSKALTLKTAGPTVVTYKFPLEKISAELKSYLDAYEIGGDFGPITFKEKKFRIDPDNLSVVAFVQDESDRKVLQATYVRITRRAINRGSD